MLVASREGIRDGGEHTGVCVGDDSALTTTTVRFCDGNDRGVFNSPSTTRLSFVITVVEKHKW